METKKIQRNPNDKRNALILLIVFASIFAIFRFSNTNKKSEDIDKSIPAYIYSQQIVEENLKSPSTADFPMFDRTFISRTGNIYTINAYVDAQNSFGATIRNNYKCVLKFENELFYVESIDIQQTQ